MQGNLQSNFAQKIPGSAIQYKIPKLHLKKLLHILWKHECLVPYLTILELF